MKSFSWKGWQIVRGYRQFGANKGCNLSNQIALRCKYRRCYIVIYFIRVFVKWEIIVFFFIYTLYFIYVRVNRGNLVLRLFFPYISTIKTIRYMGFRNSTTRFILLLAWKIVNNVSPRMRIKLITVTFKVKRCAAGSIRIWDIYFFSFWLYPAHTKVGRGNLGT